MLKLSAMSLSDAKIIAAAAAAKAAAQGWPVVIAILDHGGHLIYLERADGVQLGSITVAQQKARAALLFRRSTKVLQDRVNEGALNMLMLPGAMPIDGGMPLINDGSVVGSIGVSGVQSHQDAEVAAAAAAAAASLT